MPSTLARPGCPTISFELHRPARAPRGAVLLTHGYAEHSGRYGEVVAALLARGLLVATYDLRGHGRSEGPRGFVERFDEYLDDGFAMLDELRGDAAWSSASPPALLGHSLGGLISFHLALRRPQAFRGVALSSPFFGLALAVPAPKALAGRVLSRVLPGFGLPSGLKGADLTHDAALARAYDEDPMLVRNVPARWFTEALAAHESALADAPSFRPPLAIFAGGDDRVASVDACRRVFDRVGCADKHLDVLAGQFHEIFNEVDRTRHIALAADRLAAWFPDAP